MNYAKGSFGHWWTVTRGNKDIAGKIYNGNIDASNSGITSCDGMPREITGALDLRGCTSLTTIPDNLKVGGSLYLCGCTSLTTIPDNLKVGGGLDLRGCTSLTTIPDNLKLGGGLDLSCCTSLTTLPDNLKVGGVLDLCCCTSLTTLPNNLKVGGVLYLRSCTLLTTLPQNLNVGGSLNLSGCTSLTTLPNNLKVGGGLNLTGCTSLTTLPDNLKVGGGLNLSGCTSLTTLPDNLSVGGWIDLRGCTSLTTIPENLKVGGGLDLRGCTSLTTLPENLKVGENIYGEVYRWKGSRWSFFDGVQKEVKSVKKIKELTVYKMVDGTFAVHDGEHYSHGATLQEAKEDLIYKHSTRDLSKFGSLKLESKLTFAEAVELYRSVTGACSEGTRSFVESHGIDKSKSYTVAEILERTDGQYNSKKIREFFKGKLKRMNKKKQLLLQG